MPATMRPETPKYFLECNNPYPDTFFILTPKTLLKYPNSHLTKELFCTYGPNKTWCLDNDYDAMKLLISRVKDKDAVDWREHSTTRLRLVSKYAFELHLFEIEAEVEAAISVQTAINMRKTFILDSSIPLLKKFVKESNLDEKSMLPLFQEFVGLHIQQNYLPMTPQIYSSSTSSMPMPMGPLSFEKKTPNEKGDGKIDDDDEDDDDDCVNTKQDGKVGVVPVMSTPVAISAASSSLVESTTATTATADPFDFLDAGEDSKSASTASLRVDPSIPVVLPSLVSNSPQ
jgi:hypothetical protein